MNRTTVHLSRKELNKYSGDLLVFFAARDENKEVFCDTRIRPLLKPLIDHQDFQAKLGEIVTCYPADTAQASDFSVRRIVIVGLGDSSELQQQNNAREILRSTGGTISQQCERFKVRELLISTTGGFELTEEVMVECLTEGVLLGDYRFRKYKKDDEENPVYNGLDKLRFSAAATSPVKKSIKRANSAAYAARSARDMANEPGNGWTAAHFAKHAKKLAKNYGLLCKIIDKSEMKRLGMGGLLAVNQGSAEPPKLVILEYLPAKMKKNTQTLMLVGKGLTFDSGGVSLKPAAGMQDMKYDMCGGAAVLAAMQAIGEEKPDVRVVALIPSTDNMGGSAALKPGDIIRHYSGITSEIVNTDAEGRLILADALAYGIDTYSPDYVVDLATLTGAVIIALGHHHTGMFSNDELLSERLIAAGKSSGEPLWQLPLGKEYSKQIDSDVADIKNVGGKTAGSITAAAYLQKFVGDTAWAHLDIAGTAWDYTEKSYIPKGPSAVGVRVLLELVRNWS